jgi:hypothetical protein
MNIRLNQNIQFLSPEKLAATAPPLKPELIDKLNQAQIHEGTELILEGEDGFVQSVNLKTFLEKPEQYAKPAHSYFSIDVAGQSVVVELGNLSKDQILAALDKALSRLETSSLQGVASSEFMQSVSGLVSQVRGKGAPVIEQAQSHSFSLDPSQGTRPASAANDIKASQALGQAIDQVDQAGKLEPATRKAKVIETLLQHLGGEAYAQLPQPQQQALQHLLGNYSFKELQAVEIQGFGGEKSGQGITGSGEEGHYTSSILTSVSQLLQSGKMSQAVLESLSQLQQAPLQSDLVPQRQGLLRSALQDIAFPSTINQHAKGTCAAAVVQIMLAAQDPARYLAIATSLASPAGKVPAELMRAKGDQMVRVKDTTLDDKSGRSVSGRLMQPAFMEYGNGKKAKYDNAQDLHGLRDSETTHLIEGLYGKGMGKTLLVDKTDRAVMGQQLERSLAAGHLAAVGLKWGKGYHEILVTGIDKGQVYFVNPQGSTGSLPLKELLMQIDGLSYLPGESDGDPMAAMRALPNPLSDPKGYPPQPIGEYRTAETHFAFDPTLQALPADKREQLLTQASRLKLHSHVAMFTAVAQGEGKYVDELLKALASAPDGFAGSKPLTLFGNLQKAETDGQLSAAKARELFDSPVRKYLKVSDANLLTQALRDRPVNLASIDSLIAKARNTQKTAIETVARLKTIGVAEATIARLIPLIKNSGYADKLLERLQTAPDVQTAERLEKLFSQIQLIIGKPEARMRNHDLLTQVIDKGTETSFSAARFNSLLQLMSKDEPEKVQTLLELAR